jgi:hypothetical protein
MKNTKQLLALSVLGLFWVAGRQTASAQPNFDPQQMQQFMQQRIIQNVRDQLVVTNDAEWAVIEQRLTNVVQLQTQNMFSNMGGMMGGMRSRGGQGAGGGGFPGFGQADPDLDALQKTIDANAPAPQIKAALAKFRDARKRRETQLANAREQLRLVLSTKQEAVLVTMGLLD